MNKTLKWTAFWIIFVILFALQLNARAYWLVGGACVWFYGRQADKAHKEYLALQAKQKALDAIGKPL